MKRIADLLSLEDIRLDLEVAGKSELLGEVGAHMAQVHGLQKTRVTASLTRREMAGSTALGHGFAIPHARVAGLDRSIGAYLRLKAPIPFGAPDRLPVADVLVLLVPAPAVDEHLGILADATRLFADADFRDRLHHHDDPLQIQRLFVDWPDRAT